jgi:hypothetical protein
MAGQSFVLSDWQMFWISIMFGWKRQNGLVFPFSASTTIFWRLTGSIPNSGAISRNLFLASFFSRTKGLNFPLTISPCALTVVY